MEVLIVSLIKWWIFSTEYRGTPLKGGGVGVRDVKNEVSRGKRSYVVLPIICQVRGSPDESEVFCENSKEIQEPT